MARVDKSDSSQSRGTLCNPCRCSPLAILEQPEQTLNSQQRDTETNVPVDMEDYEKGSAMSRLPILPTIPIPSCARVLYCYCLKIFDHKFDQTHR